MSMSMRKRRRALSFASAVFAARRRDLWLNLPCTQEELEAYLARAFPPPTNKILKIDGLEPAPF